MQKLMKLLFYSCFKATELIEKKLHFKLSVNEKLRLGVHKKICEACANYEEQSKLIEKGISDIDYKPTNTVNIDDFKKSIIDKLNK